MRPIKLSIFDLILLNRAFNKVWREMRLKGRCNQFQVAAKLIEMCKSKETHKYWWGSSSLDEMLTESKNNDFLSAEREKVLSQLFETQHYRYYKVSNYIYDASPAAIVQMIKRRMTKRKKYRRIVK